MPAILTTEMFPTESAISNKSEEPAPEAPVREAAERAPGARSVGAMNHGPAGPGRSRLRRALGIVVCLEVGIFLLVAPWSRLWTGFLQLGYDPSWSSFLTNSFVRGAISGVGLLNLWFALHGVWDFRNTHESPESR